MRMVLHSVGGFAGPAGAQSHSVDLDALPAAQASQLRDLVLACDFFSLPATLSKPQPQSWDFVHTLQIQDGAQSHTVRFHEDAAPAALQKLTQALSALAPD